VEFHWLMFSWLLAENHVTTQNTGFYTWMTANAIILLIQTEWSERSEQIDFFSFKLNKARKLLFSSFKLNGASEASKLLFYSS